MVFNIYNEKNHEEDQKYTIERKLILVDILEKEFICEDCNAHHS